MNLDINFVNPLNGNSLYVKGEEFFDCIDHSKVGRILEEIPRFIKDHDDYADSFAFQWKKWHSLLSGLREKEIEDFKFKEMLRRTNFNNFDLNGMTLLECGCGGGDDTEQSLRLPFSKVYSFDLSKAVERAQQFIEQKERLVLFQASIYEIPIRDYSMDMVYCHRVLQHTPDPVKSLKAIMKKVKVGGYLFAHSYNKSRFFMKEFKYKYRPITKKLPLKFLVWYLDTFGTAIHGINKKLYRSRLGKKLAREWIPMYYYTQFANFSEKKIIEVEKLTTFDALTPAYDIPMTWEQMKFLVESEGFEIDHCHNRDSGSLYLTAKRIKK